MEESRHVAEPRDAGWRAAVALAVALTVGLVAAVIGSEVMRATHYLCDFAVGGEAGSGTWLCPDGISYYLPTMFIGGAGAGLVLISYVGYEVSRASANTLHRLARWSARLGAVTLLSAGAGLALIRFPIWWVAPYFGVGLLGWAVSARRDGWFYGGLVVGTLACLASFVNLLTLPLAAATAACWLGALAVRYLGERRGRVRTTGG